MMSPESIIHYVAAQYDREKRLKLASTLLVAKETELLHRVFVHAMNVVHEGMGTEEQREAARTIMEALVIVLLARTDAMDDQFEEFLDEIVELRFREFTEPTGYDSEEGFSMIIDPDPDDAPGLADMTVDVWAEPDRVYLSLRVITEDGASLTGSVDPEGASILQRALFRAMSDAQAETESEE